VIAVKRRDFIMLLGGAAAWPLAARAQQKAMPVIGFLNPGSQSGSEPFTAAVRQGLSEAGYVEGQNLAIEYRWAENNYQRLPELAADLVGRKVDLIVATAVASSLAAKNATSTIPIVFWGVSDPAGLGLVASLARPGGNVTGFGNFASELTPKRLEMLSELVPQAKVFALLINPNSPTKLSEPLIADLEEAARAKEVRLAVLNAGTEGEIDAAFVTLVELRAGGLVVAGDPFFNSRREQLVAQAARHAVPAIYPWPPFAAAGGLISYGINNVAVWRQAGIYAGKILKGAKPADLPVQQPTTFELVVNLKTAEALGLTVPPSILARATEVIE
jgi:putative ABC transport system substrate-binding protein